MTKQPWREVVERFVDEHYAAPHGQVRLHVVDQNLSRHLPDPPATVIDVGGGAGTQSIPLARRGYQVTIADPTPEMLQRATEAIAAEPAEVRDRITTIEVGGEEIIEVVGAASFDVVLCHGVIMYVDDPVGFVAGLVELLKPGGIVSILAKNRESFAVRHGFERDWGAALDAFDARREVNRLGFETRGDTVEEVEEMLRRAGAAPLAWYGVRFFTDAWSYHEPVPDDFDQVLRVELRASRSDPYRRLSRLFQVIARRRRGLLPG